MTNTFVTEYLGIWAKMTGHHCGLYDTWFYIGLATNWQVQN